MNDDLKILIIVITVFALIFGSAFFSFWIVLQAGAPKYIAVITSIVVFMYALSFSAKR